MCVIASRLVDPRESAYADLTHVGGANIESGSGNLIDLRSAKQEGLKSGKFLFEDGVVLYSKIRPYLVKVARPGFRGLCSADVYPLSPDASSLERGYLFYLLLSPAFTEYAISGSARAGMPKVNREHLFDYRFLLPPMSEQRRTVDILDAAFAGIGVAKASAERNLENSRAMFERLLQALFDGRGEGWVERRFEELAMFRNGINYTKASRGESIKIVGVKDFQNHFLARLDHLDSVTVDGTLPDFDALRNGDILFVRSNGNVELIGRCLLVEGVQERTAHSGFTIRARLVSDVVSPRYLCHFLKSKRVRQQMVAGGAGTNIKSLNQSILSSLVLPIPPAAEQVNAVAQIEALELETKRLEAVYRRKLGMLEELKTSLLNEAFSGRLTKNAA